MNKCIQSNVFSAIGESDFVEKTVQAVSRCAVRNQGEHDLDGMYVHVTAISAEVHVPSLVVFVVLKTIEYETEDYRDVGDGWFRVRG